ncbi:MAG: DUF3021 domain-containing protein [Oscillospiraceae bacterium]|nr:DUF3021 domain-containing protein [Oscillospiraceae bacterium]
MTDTKRQWLVRGLTGGLVGVALLLAFVYLFDAMPWMGHSWHFRNPFIVLGGWLLHGWGYPAAPAANLCLCFLMGAEAGVATLPFADSGRELVVRSLAHFAVMSATVGLWAAVNFGVRELPFFLIPLTLVYALVWLGRWVGWYAEVAAIREKLGLAPGPSLFHWKETLPYVGFAFLLCDVLPLTLGIFEVPGIPVLVGILLPYLLLPVGGFMSGLSLGRRHGLCPLYPLACGLFYVPVVFLLMNSSALFHCGIVLCAALAGNLAGAARHHTREKRGEK